MLAIDVSLFRARGYHPAVLSIGLAVACTVACSSTAPPATERALDDEIAAFLAEAERTSSAQACQLLQARCDAGSGSACAAYEKLCTDPACAWLRERCDVESSAACAAVDTLCVSDPGATSDASVSNADRAVAATDAAVPSFDAGPDLPPPPIALMHRKTFEQPDGFNGWTNPASVLVNWATWSREGVTDAHLRAASSGSGAMPAITSLRAYKGTKSVHCRAGLDGSKGRSQLELAADKSQGILRGLRQKEDSWISYAMYDPNVTPHSNWELMFEIHNNSAAKSGYGSTNNPSIALIRDSNGYHVHWRSNQPNGVRPDSKSASFPIYPNEWVRTVWHIKQWSHDAGTPARGVIELWRGRGTEPLVKVVSFRGIQVGYDYADGERNANLQGVLPGAYHGAPGDTSRSLFIDHWHISTDPLATETAMDPMNL